MSREVAQTCPMVAYQAPPSMEFSRQEYWSGLPFPSPGRSSQPWDEILSPLCAGRFFITAPPENNPLMTKSFDFISLRPRVLNNTCLRGAQLMLRRSYLIGSARVWAWTQSLCCNLGQAGSQGLSPSPILLASLKKCCD